MIYINKEFIDYIVKHCKEELPNEACGILAGKDGRIYKVYKMTNTDKSPSTFFMEPKEQLKVMKDIRNLGLEMLGIYHSHVASPAYPSDYDVRLAFYPEVLYLIVSMKDRDNPSIKSFKIKEGKIFEEEFKIVNS